MRSIQNQSNLKLALLSGILTGLAYPPTGLGFLAWFSLVPLFLIWIRSVPRQSAIFSFIASVVSNLLSIYWIAFNSGTNIIVALASMIGAILYLGLWWMGAGYVFSLVKDRTRFPIVLLPFFWVVMEWLRSFGPLGFPWLNIALSQTMFLPLIQSADLFGTYGIGFWTVAVNTQFLLLVITKEKLKPVLFITSLIVLNLGFGLSRISKIHKAVDIDTMRIIVTQPNINPTEKWEPERRNEIFETMFSLLDSALSFESDLVLWPESALPTNLRYARLSRNQIMQRLNTPGGKLLTGTPDYERLEDGTVQYYNGTIYLEPGRKVQLYRKIKLVPFGEYIPLSPIFPSLKKLNFGQANFIPGDDFTVFKIGQRSISNVICYESSFPELITEFRKNGAEVLTIQANDGWLGKSSGPYQHFELARLRAVENRMSVVRAANTGISGYILPSGVTGYKASLNKKELFAAKVPVTSHRTFYSAYPCLFPLISIFVIFCILLAPCYRKN